LNDLVDRQSEVIQRFRRSSLRIPEYVVEDQVQKHYQRGFAGDLPPGLSFSEFLNDQLPGRPGRSMRLSALLLFFQPNSAPVGLLAEGAFPWELKLPEPVGKRNYVAVHHRRDTVDNRRVQWPGGLDSGALRAGIKINNNFEDMSISQESRLIEA